MTTEEGNSIIDKFIEGKHSYSNKTAQLLNNNGLLYHCDWNWIMEAIEEIRKIEDNQDDYLRDYHGIDITIGLWDVEVKIDGKRLFTQTAFGEGQLIEAAWCAIIAFIEWYNKQPKC